MMHMHIYAHMHMHTCMCTCTMAMEARRISIVLHIMELIIVLPMRIGKICHNHRRMCI